MGNLKRLSCALAAVVIVLSTLGYGGIAAAQFPQPVYGSFPDVPGVTQEEIAAIERLQAAGEPLVYAALPSGEAFEQGGEIHGFAALYSRLMTDLFGVEFRVELREWSDILAGLNSGEIAFTGEMQATGERQAGGYIMSGAIAERTVKYTQLAGSLPLAEIAAQRKPVFVFLDGATTAGAVAANTDYEFDSVYAGNVTDALRLLAQGEADAFFDEGNSEAVFDVGGEMLVKDFFPLIVNPISLTTRTPELAPVISVLDKALRDEGFRQSLKELYRQGQDELGRHKLFLLLTPEEKAYISANPVIPIAAEHYNYPLSFYDSHAAEWNGIFFDVLAEMEKISGLTFELAHDNRTEWPDLLRMLEAGDAYLIGELMPTDERQGRFLWPEKALLTDNYTLISKADAANVSLLDVMDLRVGITTDTAYDELFRTWFPGHAQTVEFANPDEAFAAVARGEIDLVMSSQRQLTALTNFLELSGYKANMTFDVQSESIIGFNRNQDVLRSIFNKAFLIIDVDGIGEQWTQRTYDYQARMVQAQRPWLIGAAVLLLFVVALLIVLFRRSRREGARLEQLVAQRTGELEHRDGLRQTVNQAIDRLLRSEPDDFSGTLQECMGLMARSVGADRIHLHKNHIENGKRYNSRLYEWAEPGWKTPVGGAGMFLCDSESFLIKDKLGRGETIHSLASDLPPLCKTCLGVDETRSVMVIPIFLHDEFWGFVSFDNCHDDRLFTKDEASIMQSGSLLLASALLRNEYMLNLRETSDMLDTLNRAATTLLRQTDEAFDKAMTEGVNAIAGIAHIDRMSIFRNTEHPDGLHLSQIYRWAKDSGGTTEPLPTLADITYPVLFPGWDAILAAGEYVNSPVSRLSGTDTLRERYGCVSVFAVPIMNEGNFWGFAFFENLNTEKYFSANETDILRSASFMLANAVIRNGEARRIREAEERAWLMLNATPLACRLWNRDIQIIEINEAVLKLYGLKDKQEYLDRFADLMPEYQPDGQKSTEKIYGAVATAFERGSYSYEVMFQLLDGTPVPAENMLFRVPYGDDYVVAAYSRDLREQKKMLAEIENTTAKLADALEDAQQANQAKSSFFF